MQINEVDGHIILKPVVPEGYRIDEGAAVFDGV